MSLFDRARNITGLLRSEPRLNTGPIFFVVHSFGGLIVEQLIRSSDDEKDSAPEIVAMLDRIQGIVFLGTPHTGSGIATLGTLSIPSIFFRPSPAARALSRNDPDLRGLNHWYRHFSVKTGIKTLALKETWPTFLGMIVEPESANPGLPSMDPVPIDADHFGIASPKNKHSEIYTNLRQHLQDWMADPRPESPAARLFKQLDQLLNGGGSAAVGINLINAEIHNRVSQLRRSRFFVGFDGVLEGKALAREVTVGDLRGGSSEARSEALVWAARVLTAKDLPAAKQCLDEARQIHNSDSVKIADALCTSFSGNPTSALAHLSSIQTPHSRTASFLVVANRDGPAGALKWMADSGLTAADLNGDGKFFVLQRMMETEKWDDALAVTAALTSAEFDETPALLALAPTIHLAQAVVPELRGTLRFGLPFDPKNFPLADDAASRANRKKAEEFFQRGSDCTRSLGFERPANESMDLALWLRLRDPATADTARTELANSMRDTVHQLRRLPLALSFGLKLDLKAVETELERQHALTGGKSPDVALARFALSMTKETTEDAAAYIEKHRKQLFEYLNPHFVGAIEIELLAKSKQPQKAEARLEELSAQGLGAPEKDKLARLIRDVESADPTQARETEFLATDKVTDLTTLVECLVAREDSPRLTNYAGQLFRRTHDLPALRTWAQALYRTEDYENLIDELGKEADLVSQSDHLRSLLAWSYYQVGRISDARSELAIVSKNRTDDPNDRTLALNLAVASGDWASLSPLIEQTWAGRNSWTPEELLLAGQLAQQMNLPRARELIKEAARKAPDDADILAASYSAATAGGWENDEAVAAWLHRAAELSGDTGPIRSVSIKEIFDRQPDWQRHEEQAWAKLQAGEAPVFTIAGILNRSLVDLTLLPGLANPDQRDVRKRGLVYAFSGARRPFTFEAKVAAFDPSALLTASLLGIVPKLFAAFDNIVIPHSTLPWLLQEIQKTKFHQPSRVRDALELKRLLDAGQLRRFESSAVADSDLSAEIGDELALMIAEAETAPDQSQRLVVRPGPLHRVGSLMDEEADVKKYENLICGCIDVVEALKRNSMLTGAEEERARAYLRLREKPWPNPPAINLGATLYLDDVAISYLQHLGLLGKLHAAGFTAFVAPSELSQSEGLVRHDALSSEAGGRLENLRQELAAGISSGKIRLGHMSKKASDSDDEPVALRNHPTFSVFPLAEIADVVVIDDRNLSHHGQITTNAGTAKPIATTIDLLRKIETDPVQLSEYKTALRRAGFIFVPIEATELAELIKAASVSGGKLVETAELKAIRENMLLMRMRDVLQLPKEHVWWEQMTRAFTDVLKLQWVGGVPEETAKARSDWLLSLVDIRVWPIRAPGDQTATIHARYAAQVSMLLSPPASAKPAEKNRYWKWLEDAVLESIKARDPAVQALVIRNVRTIIEGAASRTLGPKK